MPSRAWIFAFDNRYYKTGDAFTRHQNCSVGSAASAGQRSIASRLLVSGTVNSHIAHPSVNPASKHGALYVCYRGDPQQRLDLFFDVRADEHVRHVAVWSVTSFR